jgi:hypothetical protein
MPDQPILPNAPKCAGLEAAIIALAQGHGVVEAARQSGVERHTLTRRMKSAAFRARIMNARTQMMDRALGILAESAASAAEKLVGLLDEEDPDLILKAACKILELGPKLREHSELAQELEELRQLVEPTTDLADHSGPK